MSDVVLIAALDRNGVIGRDGALPWDLPDDLRQFKRRTFGRPVIMGRKTWESLHVKPLPGRLNVVVTRQAGYAAPGATIAPSLEDAIAVAEPIKAPEIFVIGGAALFAEALPYAQQMVLTHVDTAVEGDVYFPRFDPDAWVTSEDESHEPDERHAVGYRVVVYERR